MTPWIRLERIKWDDQMFSEEQVELLKNITWAQHPKITLITCSDSRVDMNYFRMDALDKVFTIRNIWNVILTSEGSVDYWVEHLDTPILFILAHTNCGAVNAALNDYHHCTPDIKRELDHLMPALVNLKSTEPHDKWVEWVENNLELQLRIAEDKFKQRIEEGKLTIVGWILDIDNSYGEWLGKIFIKKIIWNSECDFDIEY
jgi:carbonic anhydrase